MLIPAKIKSREDYDRLDAWFEAKVQDKDFAAHAFRLVEDCFERAGQVPKLPQIRSQVDSWSSFCWHLYHALWGLIEAGKQDDLVRSVFQTLCDYCLLGHKQTPAKRFAMLISEFWQNDHYNDRVRSLMPPAFQATLPAIQVIVDEWADRAFDEESEMIRMGQYGY